MVPRSSVSSLGWRYKCEYLLIYAVWCGQWFSEHASQTVYIRIIWKLLWGTCLCSALDPWQWTLLAFYPASISCCSHPFLLPNNQDFVVWVYTPLLCLHKTRKTIDIIWLFAIFLPLIASRMGIWSSVVQWEVKGRLLEAPESFFLFPEKKAWEEKACLLSHAVDSVLCLELLRQPTAFALVPWRILFGFH